MRIRVVFVAMLLWSTSAFAQTSNTFPTPAGPTTVGVVEMCLNSLGQAVPMSLGTCLNPLASQATQAQILTALNAIAAQSVTAGQSKAPGVAASQSLLGGSVYNATPPVVSDGQGIADQADKNGRKLVTFTLSIANAFRPASATQTATDILPLVSFRNYLFLRNESLTAVIAVCFGCTAALNTAGSITLGPGQYVLFSGSGYVPPDRVNVIGSDVSSPVTVGVL